MKSHKLGLVFALLLSLIPAAQAALLIEPVLGYNVASKLELDGGDSYSGGRGPAFGGRLGYQQLGFQVGVDYLNSTIDMGEDDIKKDLKTSEWAAFIGFEFPILLRVYAGYIFSGTGETELEQLGVTQDLDLKGGTGQKLGIGFTVLPFLDLNVEYRRMTYDDNKYGSLDADDVDFSSYLLSVSLPFTI